MHIPRGAVIERAVRLFADMEADAAYQVRPIAQKGTDPGQAWFWTAEWQAKEREADEALRQRDYIRCESDEALLAAFSIGDHENFQAP